MSEINKTVSWKYLFILVFFALLIVAASFLVVNRSITGQSIINLDTVYVPNGSLEGDLQLTLKQGELIPASSIVTVTTPNQTYVFNLSDVVSASTVDGNFYAEGVSLSGNGSGYGVAGEGNADTEVNFVMEITTSSDSDSNETDSAETNTTESSDSNETITESNETSVDSNETIVEETESSETNETESGETEEVGEETTGDEEASESSESEESEETSEESDSEEASTSPITGQAVIEVSSEVSGSVTKNTPYTYNLESGQTASIVSSDQTVELTISDNVATVTTEYIGAGEGFGSSYIGDETYDLEIDLSDLEIDSIEGTLTISIDYQGENIASVSTTLDAETPNQTASNQTVVEVVNVTTTNASLTLENVSDYALTQGELFILQANTGASKVSITKAEIVDGRLIIRFEIGDYWLENSYDSTLNQKELDYRVELDRVKWVKKLAEVLSEEDTTSETAEGYVGEYNL